MFRLATVRAKLSALVGLPVIVMLAVLPILSWLMHGQLLDEVDDRVIDAQTSFQAEFEDDVADLRLAVQVLGNSLDTRLAINNRDEEAARREGETFIQIYPNFDILFLDPAGTIFAQLGCECPLNAMSVPPELSRIASGEHFAGFAQDGCPEDASRPFLTYWVGAPVIGGGAVVLGFPIDAAYLQNSSLKLGLELALVHDGQLLSKTRLFPAPAVVDAHEESRLTEGAGVTWAVARFTPKTFLASSKIHYAIVSALDVTGIRRIVWRNLAIAMVTLVLAAIVPIAFGIQVATVMSRALTKVNQALKKLERQEYAHVDTFRTGDELEDLAEGFNHMVDGLRERDHLKSTLGKYLTESVMDHLLAGRVQLGGESLTVSILFTDIRNFTGISERMDAQALVALLNEYFTVR